MDGRHVVVALRKESVDRNTPAVSAVNAIISSLSARRAWREIKMCSQPITLVTVALRKESVDRNLQAAALPLM